MCLAQIQSWLNSIHLLNSYKFVSACTPDSPTIKTKNFAKIRIIGNVNRNYYLKWGQQSKCAKRPRNIQIWNFENLTLGPTHTNNSTKIANFAVCHNAASDDCPPPLPPPIQKQKHCIARSVLQLLAYLIYPQQK